MKMLGTHKIWLAFTSQFCARLIDLECCRFKESLILERWIAEFYPYVSIKIIYACVALKKHVVHHPKYCMYSFIKTARIIVVGIFLTIYGRWTKRRNKNRKENVFVAAEKQRYLLRFYTNDNTREHFMISDSFLANCSKSNSGENRRECKHLDVMRSQDHKMNLDAKMQFQRALQFSLSMGCRYHQSTFQSRAEFLCRDDYHSTTNH